MFFQERKPKGKLLLTDCSVADVINLRVLKNTCVLIEDGIIKKIGQTSEFSSVDAQRFSINGKTLTPGLIDAHVHLCLSAKPDCHLTINTQSTQQLLNTLKENQQLNIDAGVTTIRDLGSPLEMLSLMSELEKDDITFPSVMASGPVLTVKDGHAVFIGVIAGMSNAANLIKAAAEKGSTLVKIIGTGGNLSPNTDTKGCQYSDEEFSFIVNEARRAGFFVACHAHAASAIDQCLQFGVRSIEHGSYMTEDQLPKFITAGAYWVPTNCPGRMIKSLSEAAQDRVDRRRANLKKAIALGVPLAAGTDAGIGGVPHGSLAHELDEFIDAGMSPIQALRTASLQNAVMMGIESKKGSIDEGKDADLLVFDGDITNNKFSFHNPLMVIKAGSIVKNSLNGRQT